MSTPVDPPRSLTLQLTSQDWLDLVMSAFDTFLQDHASCEKKASGMALSVASHYPDKPILLSAMADLAVEELTHYREVVRLLIHRHQQPGPDTKDRYIQQMNQQVRKGPALFLLDRLLVAAVVEKRGFERFSLIGDALDAGREKQFFQAIAASEDRHWELFVNLAEQMCVDADVSQRLGELVEIEADIIRSLPLRAALH